jgi:hypothetical protein
MRRVSWLAIGALGLVACSEEHVDSTDVKTSGMYASMRVEASGNGSSELRMLLTVGGDDGTIVDLKNGETLTGSAGTEEKRLSRQGDAYEATFATEAGGTEFVVAFNRVEFEDAPNSSVVLPDPFEITAPANGAEISRTSDITVTWADPVAGGQMSWSLDGDCLVNLADGGSDSGEATISGADIAEDLSSDDAESTCGLDRCLERSRSGSVDSAFGEGGEAVAIQRRCIGINSTP